MHGARSPQGIDAYRTAIRLTVERGARYESFTGFGRKDGQQLLAAVQAGGVSVAASPFLVECERITREGRSRAEIRDAPWFAVVYPIPPVEIPRNLSPHGDPGPATDPQAVIETPELPEGWRLYIYGEPARAAIPVRQQA